MPSLPIRLRFLTTLLGEVAMQSCTTRRWWDRVDESLLLGAIPFTRHVDRLHALGVRAVVNLCEESAGPQDAYRRLGIEQLHLPTPDFTPPTLATVQRALEFLEQHASPATPVYVHCKAGRGRSATVALCWLMHTYQLNALAADARLRGVRPHIDRDLPDRAVVGEFAAQLGTPDPHLPAWFDPSLAAEFHAKRQRPRGMLSPLDWLIFSSLDRWHGNRSPWRYKRPYTWTELEGFIENGCREIRDSAFPAEIVLGIKSGGAFIAPYVARCLGIAKAEYVRIDRYPPVLGSALMAVVFNYLRRPRLSAEPSRTLQGRKVLIVDDQLRSGETLKSARRWALAAGAAEVRTFALFTQGARADYGNCRGIMMNSPWGDDP